jgi:hypothetical protein
VIASLFYFLRHFQSKRVILSSTAFLSKLYLLLLLGNPSFKQPNKRRVIPIAWQRPTLTGGTPNYHRRSKLRLMMSGESLRPLHSLKSSCGGLNEGLLSLASSTFLLLHTLALRSRRKQVIPDVLRTSKQNRVGGGD